MKAAHTPQSIFDATLGLLEQLTAISSPSGDLDGLGEATAVLGRELEDRGLAVEIRHEPGGAGQDEPVLHARGRAAQDRYLLLVGHLDTVLDARVPERRDGRLFATGAIDMKGGLCALVGALDLLRARGVEPPDDLYLVVVPDEEVAGHLSFEAMRQLGGGARGLWVLEPGQPSDGGETLVLGRRGLFDWRLEVHGAGAHSGNAYWAGRSALYAAAEWCAGVRRLAAPGPGPTVNAGRLVAGDASFVDDLGARAELLGTARQLNVVPDRALVEGEARFLTAEDGERVLLEMEKLADRIAADEEVKAQFTAGAMTLPVPPRGPSRRWSEAAVAAAGQSGWAIELEEDRGGISFSNFLPDPSAIPILDGLGPVGGGMHTREEFVELASLDRRIALLADLLATDLD